MEKHDYLTLGGMPGEISRSFSPWGVLVINKRARGHGFF